MSLLIKNRTLITQFQWNDWKKFLSNKFFPSNGIRNWLKIKILPYNDEVCVANYENKELKIIKILKTNVNLAGFPDIIEPNRLSDIMRDLEFFSDIAIKSLF